MSKSINIGDNWDHLKDGVHYDEINRLTNKLQYEVKCLVEDYLHNTGIGIGLARIGLIYCPEIKSLHIEFDPPKYQNPEIKSTNKIYNEIRIKKIP